jgi:DNA polymerase I-like protein with 3'-5' exonuclease and polymerase domains
MGTFHPASVLPGRGPYINRYTIVSDYRKAVRESEFRGIQRKERHLLINPTFAQVDQILESLNHPDGRVFGCDIECLNDEVSCIGFAPNDKLSLCIPLYGDYWNEDQEAYIWHAMAKVFANPKNTAIFHNAMFDTSFMWLQNSMRFKCKIVCTMVAHRILYPDFSAKLQFVVSNYTDMPFYKDDKKIWSKPWVDPDQFYRYNARDAICLPEIWEALSAELDYNQGLCWTYKETMSNFDPCLYMMSRGILLDTDVLNTVKARVRIEHEDKLKELNEASDYEFNPGSPKQCIEYFYGHKGITPYKNRATNKPTTDDKAMSRIFRKFELPEARLVQEARALAKLLGTYLEVEYDADKRLRCFYDPRGTSTGRLSSSKTIFDKGLNFQNLDPRFKGFLITDHLEDSC